MKFFPSTLSIFAILITTTVVNADIDSGPNVGTKITPLPVFAATGDKSGKELDYSVERGMKPTVYVFVPHERFDRPIARLLKALDKAAGKAGNESSILTVFLTNDAAKTKEHLPRIQMSLQFAVNPLVVYPSATTSPEGWAINTDAQLTAIIVKNGTVVERFAYRSANETVAPEIVNSLKKAIATDR